MITIIAAVAKDNAIGRRGDLLWHIPADLRHFKALTKGHPVIMGRNTWESLPKRPLPGRLNIVITSNPCYEAPGALTAPSLPAAITLASTSPSDEIFIIGGGRIYAEALPISDALEITHIDATAPDADTFFPEIPEQEWLLASESLPDEPAPSAPTFTFRRYTRRKK